MFEVCALPYLRTPYIHSPFRRTKPFDEYRTILSHAIVKQIAESTLTCHCLDEVPYRRLSVLYLHKVGINPVPMRDI